jgi:hypothetical protein
MGLIDLSCNIISLGYIIANLAKIGKTGIYWT